MLYVVYNALLLVFLGTAYVSVTTSAVLLMIIIRTILYIHGPTQQKFTMMVKHLWLGLTCTMLSFYFPKDIYFAIDRRIPLQKVPRFVALSNHYTNFDWIFLLSLFAKLGYYEDLVIILKDSVKTIPVFGYGMEVFGYIFLSRNWATDHAVLDKGLYAVSKREKWTLLFFPEGTILYDKSYEKSRKYCVLNSIKALSSEELEVLSKRRNYKIDSNKSNNLSNKANLDFQKSNNDMKASKKEEKYLDLTTRITKNTAQNGSLYSSEFHDLNKRELSPSINYENISAGDQNIAYRASFLHEKFPDNHLIPSNTAQIFREKDQNTVSKSEKRFRKNKLNDYPNQKYVKHGLGLNLNKDISLEKTQIRNRHSIDGVFFRKTDIPDIHPSDAQTNDKRAHFAYNNHNSQRSCSYEISLPKINNNIAKNMRDLKGSVDFTRSTFADQRDFMSSNNTLCFEESRTLESAQNEIESEISTISSPDSKKQPQKSQYETLNHISSYDIKSVSIQSKKGKNIDNNNIFIPTNVLLPRLKGFSKIMECLGSKMNGILDITLLSDPYTKYPHSQFSPYKIFLQRPTTTLNFHFIINLTKNDPKNPEWLYGLYKDKDLFLQSYINYRKQNPKTTLEFSQFNNMVDTLSPNIDYNKMKFNMWSTSSYFYMTLMILSNVLTIFIICIIVFKILK